ncbi:MAG: aspartate/glutamate racemase family protein [Betaproteobacteria bacterium]
MQPVEEAFRRHWPEAERVNLLDDSLSVDRKREGPDTGPTGGTLSGSLFARIAALAQYALGCRADGILYTCSAFGEAIDAVKRTVHVPVLKPNEAMFDEAVKHGKRIGLLATFGPSVPSMGAEFREMKFGAELRPVCVPAAMAALQAGDGVTHDRLCAEAAAKLAGCDAIMLAQFSTARARAAVEKTVACPVLTSPDSAVLRMKAAL